jgi:hypothetical protein
LALFNRYAEKTFEMLDASVSQPLREGKQISQRDRIFSPDAAPQSARDVTFNPLAAAHDAPDNRQRDDQQHGEDCPAAKRPAFQRSGYQSIKVCGR